MEWKTNHDFGKQMNDANFHSNESGERESKKSARGRLHLIDGTLNIYHLSTSIMNDLHFEQIHTLTHMLSHKWIGFASKLPNAKVDL